MADLNLSHNQKITVLNYLIIPIDYQLLMIFTVDGDFRFMVVDGITQGEVQCCAFCQGAVAQEVTVIFGAVEAYFAYIAVQPFTFPAAIHAILRQDPDSLAVLQIDLHLREVRSADGISVGRRADRIEAEG